MKKAHEKIKSGFYKGYMDEAALRREAENDAKKFDKQKMHFIKALFEVMVSLLRIIGYSILFVLSSIGLTALANSEIRQLLLKIITNIVHY